MATGNGEELVIRADGAAEIGYGHLMRCLALAQAWQDAGGSVTFVTHCGSRGVAKRLRRADIRLVEQDDAYPSSSEWSVTGTVLASQPEAWVVLDGYAFDAAYQREARDRGNPLAVVDDTAHLDVYVADIIVNQNAHAKELRYRTEGATTLLLGTRYALLRREFRQLGDLNRDPTRPVEKLLVTLGGSDPLGVGSLVLRALQSLGDMAPDTSFVGGLEGRGPREDALEKGSAHSNVHFIPDANMPQLMAEADMAISGSGTTSWELAYMGVPALLVVLAKNQQPIAKSLAQAGAFENLGWYGDLTAEGIANSVRRLLGSPERRRAMSLRAQTLVDGDGASRVVRAFKAREG